MVRDARPNPGESQERWEKRMNDNLMLRGTSPGTTKESFVTILLFICFIIVAGFIIYFIK